MIEFQIAKPDFNIVCLCIYMTFNMEKSLNIFYIAIKYKQMGRTTSSVSISYGPPHGKEWGTEAGEVEILTIPSN